MDKKYKLSAEKVQELEQELAELETKGRQKISDSLDWLRSLPNNQEDVTFSDVFDDQRYLEKRILEIKEILMNSEVLQPDDNSDQVQVGCKVRVGFGTYEESYTIVSALEADPLQNKISDESPVGKALIGKRVGDTVEVDTGLVKKTFRVLDIS